jgi:hypothetical protein
MREKRNMYEILMGKPEGQRPVGRPKRSGRIILKCMLERWEGVVWTGLIWLTIRANGGLL